MAESMMLEAPVQYYSPGLRERYRLSALNASEPGTTGHPATDIHYDVDECKYLALTQTRLRAGKLETDVPPGWPKAVQGSLLWTGREADIEKDVILRLSKDDRTEIQQALGYFHGNLRRYWVLFL